MTKSKTYTGTSRVYSQNGWTVLKGDDCFVVIDPSGNKCTTARVRVISPDKIALVHPNTPDVTIDTLRLGKLPAHCYGDLTDPARVDRNKDAFAWPGMSLHRDRMELGRSQRVYNGENAPHD